MKDLANGEILYSFVMLYIRELANCTTSSLPTV